MLEDKPLPLRYGSQPDAASKKRKRNIEIKALVDLTNDDDAQASSSPSKKKKATPRKKDEEKRLRRFRQKAPGSFLEKLHRATTQRHVTSSSA